MGTILHPDNINLLITNKDMSYPSPHLRHAGFSLIELSIVMVIMGFMLAGILEFQKIQMAGKAYTTTREHIAETNKAIEVYVNHYGRLPCPASMTAKEEDPLYGVAPDCAALLASSSLTTNDGYILTEGRNKEKVLIGKIPFRELSLVQNNSRDYWNRDMYYAVSAKLTDAENYYQFSGVIDVVDAFDRSLTEANTGVQYVLLSTGLDPTSPGASTCDTDRADGENCNGNGIFRYADLSFGKTKDFYDDVLSYIVWVQPLDKTAGQCSLMEYILSRPGISVDDVTSALGENQRLFLKPGDMTYLCNRRLLNKMGMKNCMLFSCTGNNVLQYVETIN